MICFPIMRPASSALGITLDNLIIRRAKVLVRCLSSMGFMRRCYRFNRQSRIANPQSQYDFRRSSNVLVVADDSSVAGVFLVVVARAAKTDDSIYPGAITAGLDCRGVLH